MANASVIAIHDSARPLINPHDAVRCMQEGFEVGLHCCIAAFATLPSLKCCLHCCILHMIKTTHDNFQGLPLDLRSTCKHQVDIDDAFDVRMQMCEIIKVQLL